MKIKTLVIAPYPGLAELTTSLQGELSDFEITVEQGDLSEVFPLLGRMDINEYDLIMSRGGTARLLKSHTHLPVIEIPISGFDMLRILTLLVGYHTKIEMIGFPNVIEGFVSISSLINMDLSYTLIDHEDEVDEVLRRAKSQGVKVVVGDTITVKKAAEYGMQGVLITSGRESMLEAFHQAKRIYNIQRHYALKSKAYEQLFNTMDTGYIVLDGDENVRFANDAFRSLMNVQETSVEQLQQRSSLFRRLIKDLDLLIILDEQMALYDGEKHIAIVGGRMASSIPEEELYYLKIQPDSKPDREITMSYANHTRPELPQLIAASIEFQGTKSQAGSAMAVYGEKGVGKRQFALNLIRGDNLGTSSAMEIHIAKTPTHSFARLTAFLSTVYDRTLYVSGVEQLTRQQQSELASIVKHSDCQFIFSFLDNPMEMKQDKALHARLVELFGHAIVYIPPLRERLDQMNEYIRTFLITFNEKYGKQIVGLRPKVMEALLAHPWHENLLELKEVTEYFVKHAEGEYIEEDVIAFLQEQMSRRKHAEVTGIDLSKTMAEIEKEIIELVLREENFNQTKAAKRLGMNRSTLWRKLK